ncbi:MAG: alanyl-tRNA editing protein [Planctomycetes bacterium]|nr:alanyl-tRNA editing protein [Planctomycetota bacterium]
MTERLYEDDSDLYEFQATLVSREPHGDGELVILDRTAFFATSGGQAHDVGVLGGADVVDVFHRGNVVVHRVSRPLLGAPQPGSSIAGTVNRAVRADHLQQHHGQHLLSAALYRTAHIETVSVHFGEETCTLDCARLVEEAEVEQAVAAANAIVLEDRPVRAHRVRREELERFPLRREPGVEAEVLRIVEVEGFDATPCSGTHPKSTGRVGPIALLGLERSKGRTRISFICGQRALEDARRKQIIVRDLARQLSVAPTALPEQIEKLRNTEKDLRRRLRSAEESLAQLEAERLVAGTSGAVVVAELGADRTEEGIAFLGARIVALGKGAVLGALVGERAALFVGAPGKPMDAAAALKAALGPIEGRGGGNGQSARGSGPRVAGLRDAVAAAAAALSASS